MAYYDALITKWATLAPGTTAAKLAALNALTVAGPAVPMIVNSYDIYECLDAAEFAALTAANQTLVRDLLNMGMVNGSPGTKARARIVSLFSNASGPTRVALNALAAKYDAPPIPWATATIAQGGGALNNYPVTLYDLSIAQPGGLT